MKQFRDLIARRRPTTGPGPAFSATPPQVEDAAPAPAPAEVHRPDPDADPFMEADRARARAAMNAVPAPFEAPSWPPGQTFHEMGSGRTRPNIWDIEAGAGTAGEGDADEDLEADDRDEAPAPAPSRTPASAPVQVAAPQPALQPRRAAPLTRVVTPEPGPVSTPAPSHAAARPPAAGPVPHPSAPAPQPEAPQPEARQSERVRTRLLGFGGPAAADAFEAAPAPARETRYPVGWLVVVDGPGRGHSFTLTTGLSTVGRGMDQTVQLDFGDASISRSNHASVAYDAEDGRVLIGHGGKSNIVRLNDAPLVSTEELSDGDLIRLGKTTLLYVGLCGPDFSWAEPGEEEADA